MDINNYPKIKEAVLAIAHDNGCISRIETAEDVLERAQDVIDRAFPPSEVNKVEAHLASLSEEMFTAVTIGENPTAESEDPTEVLMNSLLDEVSASMFEG